MINNTKQNWTVGNTVKVGFLTLTVVAAIATPGDFKPDAYILTSPKQLYKFVPHNGLEKITADEAREMIAEAKKVAERLAAKAMEEANEESAHSMLVAELMSA